MCLSSHMWMDDEGAFLRKMAISIFEATSTERTEYLKEQFKNWLLMNDSLLQSRYRQEIALGCSAFFARRTFRPSRILRGVLTPVWSPEAITLEALDTGSRWLHVLEKMEWFLYVGSFPVEHPGEVNINARRSFNYFWACSRQLPIARASKVPDSGLQTGVRKPHRILDGLNVLRASHISGEPSPRDHFFTPEHAAAG